MSSNFQTYVNLIIDLWKYFLTDYSIESYKKKYKELYKDYLRKDFALWVKNSTSPKKEKLENQISPAAEHCRKTYPENEKLFKACLKKRANKSFIEFEKVETEWD